MEQNEVTPGLREHYNCERLVTQHLFTNLFFYLLDKVRDPITWNSMVSQRSNLGVLCISFSTEPVSSLAHEDWFIILSNKELCGHTERHYS